jgi:hypothetical protein
LRQNPTSLKWFGRFFIQHQFFWICTFKVDPRDYWMS